MTNALNHDPDVLFVGGPSEPTSLVIKQAKELGFEGGFMIMDQAKLEEMSGFLGGTEMLNGSIGVLPIESRDYEAAQTFVKNFKNKYNEKYATSESALNYQAVYVLVEAMKAAGTVDDPKAIMAAVNDGIKIYRRTNKFFDYCQLQKMEACKWEVEVGVVEDGKILPHPVE